MEVSTNSSIVSERGIYVEVHAGTEIKQAVTHICELASLYNELVVTSFNGVILRAHTGDVPDDVMRQYSNAMAERSNRDCPATKTDIERARDELNARLDGLKELLRS